VTDQETTWTPAFPGQRPPFQPGNNLGVRFKPDHELSMRHGVWSPRRVDPVASAMVEQLLADDDVAYLRAPKWGPAVWAWGRCEARIQLVTEYLLDLVGEGRFGDLDEPKVSAAYRLLDRFEAQAVQQRGRLGLDPMSAARLGKDVAQGRQADAATELTLMREEHERALRSLNGETGE
jgi:hypothetical protein